MSLRKQTKQKTTKFDKKWYVFIIVAFLAALFLAPFIWMLSTALKGQSEALSGNINIIPKMITFDNFANVFEVVPFTDYIWNSAIVTVFAVILTVFINSLAGFAFAKYKFKGRNVLFVLVVATLMVPVQIIMIPNFFILKELNWINTYSGLIIPRAAEAFGLFLARQYMMSIPDDILEASRIDGAGEFKIFMRVVLPNVKPLIAVLIIFTFMWRWNDFIWPLIVTTDSSMYTVQLGLAMAQNEHYVHWPLLMGMTLISIIPILLVFFFFQRYFVQGLVSSGVKE